MKLRILDWKKKVKRYPMPRTGFEPVISALLVLRLSQLGHQGKELQESGNMKLYQLKQSMNLYGKKLKK